MKSGCGCVFFLFCVFSAQAQDKVSSLQQGDTIRFVGIDSEVVDFVIDVPKTEERLLIRLKPYYLVLKTAPFIWESACTTFVQDSSGRTEVIIEVGGLTSAAEAEGKYFICYRLEREDNRYCEVALAGKVMFLPLRGRK